MKYKVGDKVIIEENNKIKEGIIMQVDLYGYYIHLLPYDDNFGCLFFEEDEVSQTNKEKTDNEKEILWALCDMVNQFAFRTEFYGKTALANGGLSALETAFYTLYENGLKLNSNGTIQVSNLHKFMDELKRE